MDGFRRPVHRQPDPEPTPTPEAVAPPQADEGVEADAPTEQPVEVDEPAVPVTTHIKSPLETPAYAPELPPIQPDDEAATGSGPRVLRPKRHVVRRRILLALALIIVLAVGWFGIHGWSALGKIIQKHSGLNALNSKLGLSALKGEGDGRVNILVMGIGGAGHEGPNLSDTMIVWSIDPKTNDVAAISVPRDLYVKIPGYGYGKINSANADGGPKTAEQVVSNVLGVPIHYYAVVDFSGFKQAVDAVGGVDINVATALYDTQYPCDVGNGVCPYRQPAGQIHMNGTTALKYARCRHDAPTGNCGNDYGRSARQQQLIAALKAKTLSAGTLTNPVKLTSLIDTIGSHLKTDLQLADMKRLAQIASKVDSTKIVNKVLNDAPDNYLVGGINIIPGAGYIYVPKAGNFDYDDIHDFAKNVFVDHYIVDENARIEIDNGSGITGAAGSAVKSLTAAHYNMLPAANAPTTYNKTVIYDYTGGKKPYTINYLEQRFGVKAVKASPSPVPSPSASGSAAASTPEIRIILGTDYQPTTGTSSSS